MAIQAWHRDWQRQPPKERRMKIGLVSDPQFSVSSRTEVRGANAGVMRTGQATWDFPLVCAA